MKNPFQKGTSRHRRVSDASAADQLAVLFSDDQVALAAPGETDAGQLDVMRFERGDTVPASLRSWRVGTGGEPLSRQTPLAMSFRGFGERTRVLRLSDETLDLTDDELTDYLIEAEQRGLSGTDSHPLFDAPLAEAAYGILRLPNRLVSLTEITRRELEQTCLQALELDSFNLSETINSTQLQASLDLRVETPLRAIARRWFADFTNRGERLPAGDSAVAFLAITGEGFRYGLWSPGYGIFSENGFVLPDLGDGGFGSNPYETVPPGSGGDNHHSSEVEMTQNDYSGAPSRMYVAPVDPLEECVLQILDQLYLEVAPEHLHKFGISRLVSVVWVASDEIDRLAHRLIEEFSAQTQISFVRLEENCEETILGGLLAADESALAAVPIVNLARDLRFAADKETLIQIELARDTELKTHFASVFAITAPFVMAAAALFGILTYSVMRGAQLDWRDQAAKAETARLKPLVDARHVFEANFNWYQDYIKQTIDLRRRQTLTISLLHELNSRYPFELDSSFSISDLKVTPDGQMEMKGFARSEDALTAFTRSLEFAGGEQSGQKMFGSLTLDKRSGAAEAAALNGASLPPSALSGGGVLPPGVSSWTIKGFYNPLKAAVPVPKAAVVAATAAASGANPQSSPPVR